MTAPRPVRVEAIPGGYIVTDAEPEAPARPVSFGPAPTMTPDDVRAARERAKRRRVSRATS
jgi:hypothetical protein